MDKAVSGKPGAMDKLEKVQILKNVLKKIS
jgi:hypothetical protein